MSDEQRLLAERLWSRVVIGPVTRPELGPCWLWTGGGNGHGYGQLSPGWAVHRLSLHLLGWLPPWAFALHRCDVKLCVRPTHLYPGSARQNTLDMYARGRHPRTGNPTPRSAAAVAKWRSTLAERLR